MSSSGPIVRRRKTRRRSPCVNQFAVEPAAIRDVVDCSAHAGTVFQQARAGAETFTAELEYRSSAV